MTHPTFVTEVESAWNSTTSPKTSPSISGVTGDRIVVIGMSANELTKLNTPTKTGTAHTWTLQQSQAALVDYGTIYVWTTTLTVTESFTVSVTKAGGADFFGISVHQYRDSDGFGTSNKTNAASGAPSLTTSSLSTDSAVVTGVSDWQAVDGTSRTWRSVNGSAMTESSYFRDATMYGLYVGRANAGAAGTETVGLSAPSGQKYVMAYIEVLGTSGGGPTAVAGSDSTALTEGTTQLQRASSVTDSVALTDTSAVQRVSSVSDTEVLSDSTVVVQTNTVVASDSSSLTESITVLRASSVVDSGTIGEAASLSVVSSQVDSSILNEITGLSIVSSQVDAATLSDSSSVSMGESNKTGTDSGTFVETSATLFISSQSTESWSIAEGVTLLGVFSLVDTVAFVESSFAEQVELKSSSDSSTVNDIAAVLELLDIPEEIVYTPLGLDKYSVLPLVIVQQQADALGLRSSKPVNALPLIKRHTN